jgi:hypothetical protein
MGGRLEYFDTPMPVTRLPVMADAKDEKARRAVRAAQAKFKRAQAS